MTLCVCVRACVCNVCMFRRCDVFYLCMHACITVALVRACQSSLIRSCMLILPMGHAHITNVCFNISHLGKQYSKQ